MNKKSSRYRYYKGLYLFASCHDIIIGTLFLFFHVYIYNYFGMNLPPNPAYLAFGARMTALFGFFLLMIYRDLEHSAKLIKYAVFVKLASSTIIYCYWFINPLYVDMPFRILGTIDLVFAGLFFESLRHIKK